MRRQKLVPILGLSALALVAVAGVCPAFADTCTSYCKVTADDNDDLSLFMIGTGGDVTTFGASAGSNTNTAAIDFTTSSPVTVANGNANIKGSFEQITLTPAPGSSFDGVLLRGQIGTPKGGSYNGDLTATITDKSGKVFKLQWTDVSGNGDFKPLGFDEASAFSGTIKSVTFSLVGTGGFFSQVKQVDASFGGVGGVRATPLPPTWTMMLAGLVGLGFLVRRLPGKKAAVAAV